MNIYLYKFDKEKIIENEESLMLRLPESRRAKAEKYNNPSVRAVSIAAGLLLGYAVKAETGYDADQYEIRESESGKPEIYVTDNAIHISISHSANYAAVVVADSPVGIDIEEKHDTEFRVTKRMFSEPDKERVFSSEDPDTEFRQIWTEKEAYLKCTGEGISIPMKSFFTDPESREVLRMNKVENSGKADAVRNSEPAEYLPTGYFISIPEARNKDFSISVCKDEKLALDIMIVSEL
ncbi:MAG: 4'-phosphopantetheinyl transferase superfamily protein [Eubacterium sp.]|nr:4'-phosphopantetheinyl transferase superfamily protein [Eubacterium sp.]